ncbi:trihelix transcription factor GTL1 isoform X2 [Manihot esculenta]|uniref:Myb-like domain-containing protein n=1 Tax=Manihot esculenta TaxID=3983 RepID=A0A2C9WGH8_MANES|nr:trihelix transcription factor GTL1 isoform X2 [Manihot esculenta]OAY59075.1 hypothetical protein MANES_01G001900v8 [Manihot esculenta]
MQQGGIPIQSQYGAPPTASATGALSTHMLLAAGTDQSQQHQQQQLIVEEASPISSRPPATTGNLDEFMRLSGSGDEADRAEGISSSNRWPRQETLALLQIRSDMDAAFRDATVKGPLWEDVSRKLAEMGYKRSAKKCKEKFENVHKYYKRTKEGRAGRQDGKSYRFFSQLEALHNINSNTSTTSLNLVSASQPVATTATTLDVAPVSVGIPMPVSSVRIPPSTVGMSSSSSMFPPDLAATMAPAVPVPPRPLAGISFSSTSDGSSSSSGSHEDDEDDDDDDDDVDKPTSVAAGSSRKRKRHSSKGGTRRMMEFFEGLMKHVIQKQEAMQQSFLEAIEKREHDRMIREEAWKRQELARQSRENELVAQERAIYASRDAAIIAFLQKITGQTIQLPSPVTIPAVPRPAPPSQPQTVSLAPVVTVSTQQPPPPQPQAQPDRSPLPQQDKQQQHQVVHHQQSSISSEVAVAFPEQEVPPQEIGNIGSLEPTSSRWPKAEVLALIKLRSGLESRYQEVGPKGPLWEEISAGMHRMGYKRNAKRCKEKWENINKYFKKVKESDKKRPEDAKTCPYFHELDALYRKKILGSSSGGAGDGSTTSSSFANLNRPPESQQQASMISDPLPPTKPESRSEVSATVLVQASDSQTKMGSGADINTVLPGSLFGEGNGGATKGMQRQQQIQLMLHDYEKMEEGNESDNTEQEDNEDGMEDVDCNDNDEDEDGVEDDDERQEERKMAYKIEFQRQNTNASNGGGNGTPSFLAVVQ